MITINRETDYAARVLLHLALQEPGTRVTAQQIAAQRVIPRALVRRVVSRLSAAGLVVTARGSEGGIVLARPTDQISLLDVVEAFEGPLALNACTVEPDICPLILVCTVHEAWVHARKLLRDTLAQITFDKLANRKEVPSV
ncbi:MAG: RrF2 family transcriptional regulator [Anaerolineae bacterium]